MWVYLTEFLKLASITLLASSPSCADADITATGQVINDVLGVSPIHESQFETRVSPTELPRLCGEFSHFLSEAHRNRTDLKGLVFESAKRNLIFLGESHNEPKAQKGQFYRDFLQELKNTSPHSANNICLFVEQDIAQGDHYIKCNLNRQTQLRPEHFTSSENAACPHSSGVYLDAINGAYAMGFRVYAVDNHLDCSMREDVSRRKLDIMQCRDNHMQSLIVKLMSEEDCRQGISINGQAHLTPTRPAHEPLGVREFIRQDGSQISTFNINLAFLGFKNQMSQPYDGSVNWFDQREWVWFRMSEDPPLETLSEEFLRDIYPQKPFLTCPNAPMLSEVSNSFAALHKSSRDFPFYFTSTETSKMGVGSWSHFDATFFLAPL